VPGSSSLGHWFPAIPPIIPYALISLPFVLGFRLSCYYYRRAYYRAFWRSPAACAVREPHAKYSGETRFPLIVQNLHRYFFYLVVLISILNTYDVIEAFHPARGGFGFGMGTLILLANVVLLWAYTLSCHTCRHITGGRLKNFSSHPVRYWFWTKISWLNARHMQLAWITLGTLMLTGLLALLLLAAAAMGLQSTAVRRLGQMSTTYLTSTLTGVITAVALRRWPGDGRPGPGRRAARKYSSCDVS
jgi:hypothetical protein